MCACTRYYLTLEYQLSGSLHVANTRNVHFAIGQQHHEEIPLTLLNLRCFCPLCTSILRVPFGAN